MIKFVTKYIDLNSQKFLIRPKPQKNELLSSWLVRVARAHNTHTTSFTNMHFKEYKSNIIWARDLDIWCPNELIERISFKSGYSKELVFDLTLRSLEGIVAEHITGKSCTKNIRPLGNYCNIKTKGGLQFCPVCLKEDSIPYFKKEWRLTFFTHCLKHNIKLLDRCPNCLKALTIFRNFQEKSFVYCYYCGHHLIKPG